ITPENGSMQDFSNGPVTYTVTSEDGAWKREYTVVFHEASLPSFKFSFEHVEVVDNSSNRSSYHNFYEVDSNGTRHNIWASGNPGAAIIAQYDSKPETFPTYSTDNGYVGKGVCMNTQTTGSLGQMMNKPIAAGNLFLGKFNVNNVLFNPLKTTEFGIPMNRVPVRVTGYYKYQPGPEYTNAKKEVVPGRVDQANAYAVFYRNTDANGKSVVLLGDDVLTNPLIVKIAQVESLPPTNEWTRFEMFFKGGEVDDAILEAQGYSLTLVFSSSKEGDYFEGAVGSTLYIDEVEVSFENEEEIGG
ncbi:MAG: PCMD domain-containing protein, partial [Prevotella sp.]|nr:PCMD domain-containing protein [Prevotella sp.]